MISAPLASGGEQILLQKAGADKANPQIREILRQETPAEPEEKSFIDKLNPEKQKADPVVDARKEAERLKENKDKGKPVNSGKVPEIKPGGKSTLERIFE